LTPERAGVAGVDFAPARRRAGYLARTDGTHILVGVYIPSVEDQRIEDILDTIGDNHARHVLAAISREPKSAKELAEECDLSLPTVYRRLEMLDEYDLVKDRTLVADDGNHYKVYESKFESTVISLEDDQYKVRIYREENLPERFGKLWDDLNPE
jgi:DNA-binding HxlR family transcriptional regulator